MCASAHMVACMCVCMLAFMVHTYMHVCVRVCLCGAYIHACMCVHIFHSLDRDDANHNEDDRGWGDSIF